MSKILIRGGRVIDPARQIDRVADLLIEDGKIVGLDVERQGGGCRWADGWESFRETRLLHGLLVRMGGLQPRDRSLG